MRVLWFTNVPLPAVQRRAGLAVGGSGHWMSELLEGVAAAGEVRLSVATAYPGLPALDFEERGVRYLALPQSRFTPHLLRGPGDLARAARAVEAVGPDLVHVHGSERFYGLLASRGLARAPLVVSIQGLVSAYLPAFFGALSPLDVARTLRARELATRGGLAWEWLDFALGARQEREVLRGARAVLGRTAWDRAHGAALAPQARYFHVGELLRPAFFERAWSLAGARRRRILLGNAGAPRRGVETVLEALAALRRFPDAELAIAGNVPASSGYGAFLRARIARLGLEGRVKLLGYLDAPALAAELCAAHAYVIASTAENSPNSLCEAQAVGTPCVASSAGGIPSLVEDGRTGLLFPPGDAPLLSAQLERLLDDDLLAARLSAAAREEAARRHDRAAVVAQLHGAYRAVAGGAPVAGDPAAATLPARTA